MAMIATSWEVCWLHQSKYHHQAHLDLVPENTHVGSHVAAIPTPAVWRQQLWSGEVVHLQPPAVQTSAVRWYYSPQEQPSTDGTEYPAPLWYCHYQRSLYCHYLITVGDPGSGDKQIHISQRWILPCPRVLTSPTHQRFSSLYLVSTHRRNVLLSDNTRLI